jgi:hypothetical protein
VFDVGHPDFGAQIAVWVESADGTRFVDTLMVTSAVGIHGIGNRPGSWDLRSGPRFPYGRRQMALPIWAHARGELYDLVVMEGGRDDEITTHEEESSPEPYFCRPMMVSEEVDAVTCPSGRFRSCKGVLDASMSRSYYPPRADLYDFGSMPCMILPQYLGSCDPGDSDQYGFLNDVDTVAAATPAYGAPTTNTWVVPTDLPDGDYALLVEVGKEFDTDAANQHPSFISADEMVYYGAYGQDGNIGALPRSILSRRRGGDRRGDDRHRGLRRLERRYRRRERAGREHRRCAGERGGAPADHRRPVRPGARARGSRRLPGVRL